MAIYHASLRVLTRSQGHSAVAAAAYRAGIRLTDERTGLVHDFTRKCGVLSVRMEAPADAPPWATDIEKVWNEAEGAETRVNARVARDLVIGLPHEIPEPTRAELAHRIAQDLVSRYRCAVLVALHAPDPCGDGRNFHAHLMLTTRCIGPAGFGAKIRVLDDRTTGPQEVEAVRRLVAERTNQALSAVGVASRVDHRSLDAQARAAAERGDVGAVVRLARQPTRHLGRAATAALRRGGSSPRQAHNRSVQRDNRDVRRTGQARLRSGGTASPHSRARVHIGDASLAVRATGASARVLNEQATRIQERLRVGRDIVRMQTEAMERESAQVDREFAKLIAALNATAEEAERLRRFLAVAGEDTRIRVVVDAHEAWEVARADAVKQRDARGKAAVRTAEARRSCRETEAQKPPAWRPLTRRQWAQRRRAERAAVAAAEAAERTVLAEEVGGSRLRAAEAALARARTALWAAVDDSERLSRSAPIALPAASPQARPVLEPRKHRIRAPK